MRKIYFPILILFVLFSAGHLHAQTYKTTRATEDSIGHIVLKPTVLQRGGELFVEQYRKEPFILNFFNEEGARVATYLVRDNSFYVNTSGWGRGIYFYYATDAFHPFIDSGKILVL